MKGFCKLSLFLFLIAFAAPIYAKFEQVKKCPIDTVNKEHNFVLTANGTQIPLYNAVTPKTGICYVWLKSDETINFKLTGNWQGAIRSIMYKPLNPSPLKQSDPAVSGGTTYYRTSEFTVEPGNYVILDGPRKIFVLVERYSSNIYDTIGSNVINVRSAPYNADNTGASLASPAIQKAIDEASKTASGGIQKIVYVPAGTYEIGTIFIKSNVNLHLAEGAILKGSKRTDVWVYDYAFDRIPVGSDKDWYSSSLIFFKSFPNDTVRNAKISGYGVLDGSGDYWRGPTLCKNEPTCYEGDSTKFAKGIAFHGAFNCVAEGVMLRNSVFWNMIILGGAHNKVRNVKIFGNFKVNNDGINFDNTQHARLDNIASISCDDGTCFKADCIYGWYKPNMYDSVTNSIFTAPGYPTVKFGWALHKNYFGYFDNVHVHEYMKWEATKLWYKGAADPTVANDNKIVVSGFVFKNMKINGEFAGNKSAATNFWSTNNKFEKCEFGGPISLINFDTLQFVECKVNNSPLLNDAGLGVAPVNSRNITYNPTTKVLGSKNKVNSLNVIFSRSGKFITITIGEKLNGSVRLITPAGKIASISNIKDGVGKIKLPTAYGTYFADIRSDNGTVEKCKLLVNEM